MNAMNFVYMTCALLQIVSANTSHAKIQLSHYLLCCVLFFFTLIFFEHCTVADRLCYFEISMVVDLIKGFDIHLVDDFQ